MANVKLKKKKYDGGYEQLYPHTLAKNVMTGTGNVDTDIIMLRQRIVNLEYTKTPIVIEVEERSSDGSTQAYEALGINAWHFQNTEANLKIVFNETNRGGNIVIDATDEMGMIMNYPILAGFYNREFEDGEIKPGKIYDLLYHNYQFYLTGSDSGRDDLFFKKLNIAISASNNIVLMNAYLSGNVLIVNGFLTDPTTFNSAAPSTEFVNLGTMIPEIKDYIVVAEPIAGMNLVLSPNFALTKSTSASPFYTNHHFTIIAGITKR